MGANFYLIIKGNITLHLCCWYLVTLVLLEGKDVSIFVLSCFFEKFSESLMRMFILFYCEYSCCIRSTLIDSWG